MFRALFIALVVAAFTPALALAGPAPIVAEDGTPGPTAPAALDGMLGQAPSAGTTGMLAAGSGAKARHGLGLPSYAELLGKGSKGKAAAADAHFAEALDSSAEPVGRLLKAARASSAEDFDRIFKANDAVKGPHGKQTRKLKVASELSGGCPTMNELGTGYGWTGSGRATYEVTTTEQVGKFDVVTAVVIDGSFHATPGIDENATADDFFGALYGEIAITRNQVAINRKTGKRTRLGETERFTSNLDPFYKPEGNFEAFVASQDDERPAPPRTLRSDTWEKAAGWFMMIPLDALRSNVAAAEKLAQTPNACVTVSFDTRPLLAPSETLELTGIPKLTHDNVTPFAVLQFTGRIQAEWINMQGQSARPLNAMRNLASGRPWYEFTAPPQAWPASAPVGLDFTYTSAAGVAKTPVQFRPLEQDLYYRVLDLTGTVDATDVKTVSSQCTFTGGPQHIDLGLGGGSTNGGQLNGDFGSIHAPISDVIQPYSTSHVCPSGTTNCDFPTESLPNQQLGINLHRVEDRMHLDWSFVSVQLGDSRCSLQVPDVYVDRTLLSNDYPLSAFQGTAPFVVENHATQPYSVQQGSSTMTGQLRWSFQMTLQRVDAAGQPLS